MTLYRRVSSAIGPLSVRLQRTWRASAQMVHDTTNAFSEVSYPKTHFC